MTVFNPKILDASVRDVVSVLSSDQKTDVLLYAMECITSGPNSRTTIENAVQSVLQVAAARPDKLIQARLIRAKARFAAGMRGAAHQDLQKILQIDPHHREAASLMPSGIKCITGEFGSRLHGQPRFSNEIWREIASYLAKRDLKSLLLVPHALSSIAGQLLFRRVHLHFGTSNREQRTDAEQKVDEWHARRSAEILSHLVSDSAYAGYVESLVIFAPENENSLTSFQIAMISNVLPKLKNLKTFGCRMSGNAMQALLVELEKSHPKLQNLILEPTRNLLHEFPTFSAIRRFAYSTLYTTRPPTGFQNMVSGTNVALRSLVLVAGHSPMEAGFPPVSNLTSLDLDISFSKLDVLVAILSDGRHLENLRLRCRLTQSDFKLSVAFRTHVDALPTLRHFVFILSSSPQQTNDPDLFPAITEFVRMHSHLRTLSLSNTSGRHTVGYNAVVWSVLPTLAQLENLSMDIPRDLTPALSSWLIPRKVTSLHLRFSSPVEASFLTQLWPGLPKNLKLLAIPTLEMSQSLLNALCTHLPKVDLLILGAVPFTINRTATGIEAEEWSNRRATYYLEDGLEAIEVDADFAPWTGSKVPWHW